MITEKFDPQSRLWVYQSEQAFTPEEEKAITEHLSSFCAGWKAHGADLLADFEIINKHFIVLVVDEKQAAASGCSIDASVHVMQALATKLSRQLLDRSRIAFKQGNKMVFYSIHEIPDLIQRGIIQAGDYTYQNYVSSLHDFKNKWEVSVSESWMASYFVPMH